MLLALTCSSSVGSICVSDGEKILETRTWESERSHAEFVSQKISEITKNYPFDRIKALAVDVGPGSFTGIRIAVNTIKTLSYALNLPIVTANSLEILAHQVSASEMPTICMIDAFSQSVYTSTFHHSSQGWTEDSSPRAVKASELKNLFKSRSLCLGDGFQKYSADIDAIKSFFIFEKNYSNVPTAEILSKIAYIKWKKNDFVSWEKLEPLYVRRSSAEEKLLV